MDGTRMLRSVIRVHPWQQTKTLPSSKYTPIPY